MKIFFGPKKKNISVTLKKTVASGVVLRLLCYALMQSALNNLTLASELTMG